MTTNLVSNAIKYTQPGGKVAVSTRSVGDWRSSSSKTPASESPEDDLPLLFDRFHRVDTARSRGSGGSGLGLAICRSIVEAHGGTITVSSVLDHGSRFTVTVPRSVNTSQARLDAPECATSAPPRPSRSVENAR